MQRLDVPFNVKLLSVTPDKLVNLKPVKTMDRFEGATRNFNEDGLFSSSIFGKMGDPRRKRRFSYIDIKIPIFHPLVYFAIVKLKAMYGEILAGKIYATWDPAIHDFVKSNALEGDTGYNFFLKHWEDIEFEERPSVTREENISLIQKYKEVALTSKIIVLPAGLRDIEINEYDRITEDEVNSLYLSILAISNSINKDVVDVSPEALNSIRMLLQLKFNTLYETFENLLQGKKKLFNGKWTGRKIFDSTRNVITAMSYKHKGLGQPGNPSINSTMIGLFQYLKAITPITKYCLKNGFLLEVFPGPDSPVNLVNKKTLKRESVNLKRDYYDTYMTDEGLDRVINGFGEDSVRRVALEIDGRYIGLMYKGKDESGRKDVFKLFSGIDELPAWANKDKVTPITYQELMYCAVYYGSDKTPLMITRYPTTGIGSTYPSYAHLLPTVQTETRYPLDANWAIDEEKVAYDFPTNTEHYGAMAMHPNHLAKAGADHDGDMTSCTALFSTESREEIEKLLNSKHYYVNFDGRLTYSAVTDTVLYVLKNMTGK